MSLMHQLAYLREHPITRMDPFGVARRWLRWQLSARKKGSIQPWIEGTQLFVERGRYGASGAVYLGLHEVPDMALVAHFLRPDELFLDVGANLGTFSVLAAAFARARVIAFEPDPATYQLLAKNFEINGLTNVSAHACAVGDMTGEVRFSVGADSMNRIVHDTIEASQVVPIDTLDRLLPSAAAVHGIKIDVEGAELQVLAGANRALSGTHTMFVQVEVATGAQGTAVYDVLHRYGFDDYFYDPERRTFSRSPIVGYAASNLLFIRNLEEAQARVQAARKINVFRAQL